LPTASSKQELQSVQEALYKAAGRGERMAGRIRIFIVLLALVQYLAFNGLRAILNLEPRPVLVVGNLLIILLVSFWMLSHLARKGPSKNLLMASVGVDCLAVVMVVWPTAMWPEIRYEGILDLPNMGFFVLAIFLSGFRLDPRLSIVSFVFNSLGLTAILVIDHSHGLMWGGYGVQELVVLFILLSSAALLAVAVATRSRTLAHEAGVAASEKAKARRQLGVYVPEEVVNLALEKGALGLDGKEKAVAVLFVDLRGFTQLCADKEAGEVVKDLNAWLHEIVEVIQEERGTVDKYIGDCVMAVFGMVETEGNEASRALRTAARIVTRMKSFNDARSSEGLPAMGYGVGLHYGVGIVGSMGGAGRLQYTVIGDVVNRASRLEAATKDSVGSVLMSKALYDRASSEAGERLPHVNPHAPVHLRGIDKPVDVFSLG
jgi:class 3 adenylate cyclase